MSRWKTALLAGSASLALAGTAGAQMPSPAANGPLASPPAPTPTAPTSPAAVPSAANFNPAPLYDPNQLPVQHGRVQQFTLTPRGDIDGLILADGTEVKTPPHLSTQIAFAVKPGDNIVIHGLHAAALPLVQAVSITDEASGRTVIDDGPPPPGPAPPPPAPDLPNAGPSPPIRGLAEVQGRVRLALHGPRGDINGVLLEDGTILRLPPPEAARFTGLLQPGQPVVTEGDELTSPLGKVVEVRQLGPSRTQLSLVAEPRGPGRPSPPPPPDPDAGPAPPPPARP